MKREGEGGGGRRENAAVYVRVFFSDFFLRPPLPAGGMRCLQLFSLSFFSFGIRKNFFAASEEIMTQKQKKGREGEYFYVLSAQPP